ncbi:MAG TPA: 2-phospho-L-lactate transferase [Actinomycetota bacterium]|nr:2-phospho-L-lactate transferase [Actinomycetota bacterium]
MKVAALSGGVGGAKLLVGLDRALRDDHDRLTAIVNTADDATIYGVHVSPDVDIVTYWLAGVADTERGWGMRDDTFTVVTALEALGEEAWFRLGDRDLGTCMVRTRRLERGDTLTEATRMIATAFGLRPTLLPMSDDRVRTTLVTQRGRVLDFQEYFVKERCEPDVVDVLLSGVEVARPAPGVIEALEGADIVILCPSNPIVSTGPILALPGVRDALRRHPLVVAVSPIVGGRALKGPAEKLLRATGTDVSAQGVAGLYSDLCDVFVIDTTDAGDAAAIEDLGVATVVTDTIMTDHDASAALARVLLTITAPATPLSL